MLPESSLQVASIELSLVGVNSFTESARLQLEEIPPSLLGGRDSCQSTSCTLASDDVPVARSLSKYRPYFSFNECTLGSFVARNTHHTRLC